MTDISKTKFLSLKATIIPFLMVLSASFATNASAQSDTPTMQEAACNAGNSAACTALGIRLTDGVGIAKDEKRGADLFLKACQGQTPDARGCMLWGYAMQTGRGAYVNPAQGAAFYDTACNMNDALGCNNYGLMRRDGNGVVKNEIFASSAFSKSCRLLFAEGCLNEGNLFRAPTVIAVNPSLALRAYEKGCGMGNLASCHNQAWYLEGGKGISQDRSKAAQLYTTACLAGFELSCQGAQNLTGTRPGQSAQSASTGGSVSSQNAPPAPNAAIGHVVCSVINTQEKKMWVTWGFTAPESRHQELANAYLQKLLSDGAIQRRADYSNFALDCRGHRSLADATRFKNDLMRGAAANRYVFRETIFNPI